MNYKEVAFNILSSMYPGSFTVSAEVAYREEFDKEDGVFYQDVEKIYLSESVPEKSQKEAKERALETFYNLPKNKEGKI
jgi:hypothetical protein